LSNVYTFENNGVKAVVRFVENNLYPEKSQWVVDVIDPDSGYFVGTKMFNSNFHNAMEYAQLCTKDSDFK
jgi:hypothetical protein